MSVFDAESFSNHEQVCFLSDKASGLKAIIALHNSALGPSVGGCRMRPYESEAEALHDVLRLSKGMTYKCAVAGLPFGGGKSVIIGDPRKGKTPELLLAFGRLLNRFKDIYMTGQDMGMSDDDFVLMQQEADNLIGVDASGTFRSPGELTALGVFLSMQTAVKFVSGNESLSGLKVGVQGLGHVGYTLCDLLQKAGAELFVNDIDTERQRDVANKFSAEIVNNNLHSAALDIYAPCATGGFFTEKTINELACKYVIGSANNQLRTDDMADVMKKRNIVYVPDFVANAGGVIRVAHDAISKMQGTPYSEEEVEKYLDRIPITVQSILEYAKETGSTTLQGAQRIAEERIRTRDAKFLLS